MTKLELNKILEVLLKIKNKDSYALECIHIVQRDIERYNNRKGQLKELFYEQDW